MHNSEIAQMVELVPSYGKVPSSNPGLGDFCFNREITIFGMNPGKDFINHAETRLSDIL